MFSTIKQWLNRLCEPPKATSQLRGIEGKTKIDFLSDIDRKAGTHLREALDQLSANSVANTTQADVVAEKQDSLIPIFPEQIPTGYDIVGDIHGHATELELLLEALDYQKIDEIWQHPYRKIIFTGDYIDKGPEQIAAFEIVRNMVDAGKAFAIMGNHEFNAVTWATPDIHAAEAFLRPHTTKNYQQTKAFLEQVDEGSALHKEIITWLSALPLFIDLPGLRVIHACWSDDDLVALRPYLDRNNAMRPESWQLIANESSTLFPSLEVILKGPEVQMPESISFFDDYGHERTKPRIKWWSVGSTYRELALVPPSQKAKMPDMTISDRPFNCHTVTKPLFFGHYTFRGEPEVISEMICCVDYAVTDKNGQGKLCAYRWHEGDNELSSDRLLWINKNR